MADERVIPPGFYVYTHARPDGTIFYVGKGKGRRAWDFSPKRRTRHHRNIAVKHGLSNILVVLHLCETEEAAFALERAMIARFRAEGMRLINLTSGGEGAAGRPFNEKSAAAFAEWRGRSAWERMPEDSKRRILEGRALGREKAQAWRKGPEGQAFLKTLGKRSAAKRMARPFIEIQCARCSKSHLTKTPTAKYCKNCTRNGARNDRVRQRRQNKREVPGGI